MSQILVVANSSTYEAAAFEEVSKILLERGASIQIYRQDKCLNGDYLTFEMQNNHPGYFVTIGSNRYNINDFSTIWYMHPFLPKELLLYEPIEFRHYISTQFMKMREVLWTVFQSKRWVNDPWKTYRLENKIYQSYLASEAGLKMPDTIIGSNPEEIRRFYVEHSRKIVVKNFATSPIPDRVVMTNLVTEEDYLALDSAKIAPAIYQEYVDKLYELRITVVGNKIFVTNIYSQEDSQTAIDWRSKPLLNDFQVRMEPGEVPTEIKEKILHFMSISGLQYGCIDMIRTPDDRYIFLEINPAGQWYFVQVKTKVQIANAIAELLLV